MAEPVKNTRRYNSPQRRDQAATTRRRILEAAQTLFEREGYAVTTMTAIAKQADVALKTVYVVFETKSGVLRALWQLLLGGDDEETAVAQRGWYREVVEEPDPERQLRLNARNSRMVKLRAGGLLVVIRDAAPVDPDIAALWEHIQSDFHDNQGSIVKLLNKKKALRRELNVSRATDILWTLNHPDVWQLLVVERGWTPEDYEQWFADASCAQLLKADSASVERSGELDVGGQAEPLT